MYPKKIPYLFLFLLIIISANIVAQDIILKTNGAQINADVVKISEDSVWFKNKNMYGNPVMGIPKTEIKLIEYWNGKKDYFSGSYVNLSEKETTNVVTSFKANQQSLSIDYLLFRIENLFTETHLILEYTKQDSAFTVAKGKMEFIFENPKNNFFVKLFPTGKKTVFTKFEFIDGSKNKYYERLTNYNVQSLEIYMNDSVSFIPLDEVQSAELLKLFSSKEVK
jgi:hypothetical protein